MPGMPGAQVGGRKRRTRRSKPKSKTSFARLHNSNGNVPASKADLEGEYLGSWASSDSYCDSPRAAPKASHREEKVIYVNTGVAIVVENNDASSKEDYVAAANKAALLAKKKEKTERKIAAAIEERAVSLKKALEFSMIRRSSAWISIDLEWFEHSRAKPRVLEIGWSVWGNEHLCNDVAANDVRPGAFKKFMMLPMRPAPGAKKYELQNVTEDMLAIRKHAFKETVGDPALNDRLMRPLWTRHFVVDGTTHLRNGKHVADMKDNFLFGKTYQASAKAIQECLLDDYNILMFNYGCFVALVGHSLKQDLATLESVIGKNNGVTNCETWLDTMTLFPAAHEDIVKEKQQNSFSLTTMLETEGLTHACLHNAGNDAFYTGAVLARILDNSY